MLTATIVALALASQNGGPSLAPGPAPIQEAAEPAASGRPVGFRSAAPIPEAALVAVLGAAAHVGARRRRWEGPTPGDAVGLTEDPLFVFVGGHGTDAGPAFGPLIDLMGLRPDQARFFDYRWMVEDPDAVRASEKASIDATADALNAYVAGLGGQGRPIYLIGFSKGGAGIAELLARWDEGSPVRVGEVRGAVLLDPPLASGVHGFLQSLGRLWGPIPDDGGYDPIVCDPLMRCRDRRAHLGRASGVEVLVIRNPKAGITNFDDRPEGLRIIDMPDAGPGPLAAFLSNPFGYASRVAEAHHAVLTDERVADCIVAEVETPGSCASPQSQIRLGPRGGGGSGAVLVM